MTQIDRATELARQLRNDFEPRAQCVVTGASISPIKDIDKLRGERRAAADAIEALLARVKALEGALEPFCTYRPHKREDGLAKILVPATVQDVRLASAALSQEPTK